MKKRYSVAVIMILSGLLLGGCSLITGQSTKKYEETYFGETEELSDLLTSNHSGKHP